MKTNLHLKNTIMEVVDNQLKSNDPPETRQTYDRLISEGYSEKEAKELIGCVVTSEFFDVLNAYSGDAEHRFRRKPNRHSGRWRTVVRVMANNIRSKATLL